MAHRLLPVGVMTVMVMMMMVPLFHLRVNARYISSFFISTTPLSLYLCLSFSLYHFHTLTHESNTREGEMPD